MGSGKHGVVIPPDSAYFVRPIATTLYSMKKKLLLVLHVSIAVALCANGLAAPAAADDGPIATPASHVAAPAGPSLRNFSIYDVFVEFATRITTGPKTSDQSPAAPVLAPAPAPALPATVAPQRAAPAARSHPRTFSTYDELVEHANAVATTQQIKNDELAAVMAREDAARAALAAVFDPRVRGGLRNSRTELMDDATLQAIRAQLADDAATTRQLLADGAIAAPATSWRLPLVGENTQDFGPTPYWFEPGLTYQGVYYQNFHEGTDIAAPWGSPIHAPAWGLVVFAGPMGDGAEVVVIAHDDGLVSLYAHLDRWEFPVPVKAGDTVQAGDRIGNVGLTGITTGAHLHWAVWRNGELIDPLATIGG
jgi:murein DD-endopeptidase MepM/ murein hydrolase activator NlpD